MDKRKLALTAGGASIVAAALAMNVGTAAADGEDDASATFVGGEFSPMVKIDAVIAKIELQFFDKFDKAVPAVTALDSVLGKLEEIFFKFDE